MNALTDCFAAAETVDFRYTKGDAHIYHTLQIHPYYEFYFFLGGSARYIDKDQWRSLVPGTLVIIPPGKYHRFQVSGAPELYERCVLNIYPDFPQYAAIGAAVQGKEFLVLPTSDRIFQNFLHLKDSIPFLDTRDIAALLPAITLDILCMLKYRDAENIHEDAKSPGLAEALMEYLDAHFADPLQLADLALQFNYSVSYICHMFKSAYGISIKNYVLQKRLNAVHLRILHGEKVQEAAHACGFEDYSAFFRLYKKMFGTSPSQYRKQKI